MHITIFIPNNICTTDTPYTVRNVKPTDYCNVKNETQESDAWLDKILHWDYMNTASISFSQLTQLKILQQ